MVNDGLDIVISSETDYNDLLATYGTTLGLPGLEVNSLSVSWADVTEQQLASLLVRVDDVAADLTVTGLERATSVTKAFAAIRSIGGSFTVTASRSLTSVELPELTLIGGDLRIASNGGLIRVRLAALPVVGGAFQVVKEPEVAEVAMPVLVTVGGEVRIEDCQSLSAVSFPVLEAAGSTVVGGAPRLKELCDFALKADGVAGAVDLAGSSVIKGNATLLIAGGIVAPEPCDPGVPSTNSTGTGSKDCDEGPGLPMYALVVSTVGALLLGLVIGLVTGRRIGRQFSDAAGQDIEMSDGPSLAEMQRAANQGPSNSGKKGDGRSDIMF